MRMHGLVIVMAFANGCGTELPMPQSLAHLNAEKAARESKEGASDAGPSFDASSTQEAEAKPVDEPVPTAGVFLVCQEDLAIATSGTETGIGCRLQDKDGVKVANLTPMNPRIAIVHAGDGLPLSAAERSLARVDEERSSASPWHWILRHDRSLGAITLTVTVALPDGTDVALKPAPVTPAAWQRRVGGQVLNVQPLSFTAGGTADGRSTLGLFSPYLIPYSVPVQLIAGQAMKAKVTLTFGPEGNPVAVCEYGTPKEVANRNTTVYLPIQTCTSGQMAGSAIVINTIAVSLREKALPSGVADDRILLQFNLLGHPISEVERKP